MSLNGFVVEAIEEFCDFYLRNPYVSYTEHGFHAYFYNYLYNKLPIGKRYMEVNGFKVCLLQKEYPTFHNLDKSRRQNWDIAVLQPTQSNANLRYDYLELDSVVEFGLNETIDHLKDDIARLTHEKSNVRNKYVIHIHRLSGNDSDRISGRDWTPRSKRIVEVEDIKKEIHSDVVVYYAMFDESGTYENGVWKVTSSEITRLV